MYSLKTLSPWINYIQYAINVSRNDNIGYYTIARQDLAYYLQIISCYLISTKSPSTVLMTKEDTFPCIRDTWTSFIAAFPCTVASFS